MMKFVMLLVAALLLGCGRSPESDFEKALRCIDRNDAVGLESLLRADRTLISQVAPFDQSTLLDASMTNLPHLECARLLVKYGSDVHRRGGERRTPLHLVCDMSGDPDSVLLLLESGAEVNATDASGRTPLNYANARGKKEAARILIEWGGK